VINVRDNCNVADVFHEDSVSAESRGISKSERLIRGSNGSRVKQLFRPCHKLKKINPARDHKLEAVPQINLKITI